jgi:hypothetical protein
VDETNPDGENFYDPLDENDPYNKRKKGLQMDIHNMDNMGIDFDRDEKGSSIKFKSLGKEEDCLFKHIDSLHEEAIAVWEFSTGED